MTQGNIKCRGKVWLSHVYSSTRLYYDDLQLTTSKKTTRLHPFKYCFVYITLADHQFVVLIHTLPLDQFQTTTTIDQHLVAVHC
jgi:hypothetical protein